MNFTDQRSTMLSFTGATIPDYQLKYLTTEVKDLLNNLGNKFVEFLTKDIIEEGSL